jgi:hypothetical protein
VDEPLVLIEGLERVVEVDARLRDDVGKRGEPGLADVQERDHLGMAVRQDVAGKRREGRRARAARVHDGGDAREHAAQVRVHPGAIDSFEHVGVEIDEAGRDELAADLDDPRRLARRDVGRDARDLAVLHRDVLHTVEPGGWIEDTASLQHEIEHGSSRGRISSG